MHRHWRKQGFRLQRSNRGSTLEPHEYADGCLSCDRWRSRLGITQRAVVTWSMASGSISIMASTKASACERKGKSTSTVGRVKPLSAASCPFLAARSLAEASDGLGGWPPSSREASSRRSAP
eukprot:scaffold211916_cov31-Tisochrysis_lutea.AAC.8